MRIQELARTRFGIWKTQCAETNSPNKVGYRIHTVCVNKLAKKGWVSRLCLHNAPSLQILYVLTDWVVSNKKDRKTGH